VGINSVASAAPETLRQARRWDEVKLRYTDASLCDRCAAQAAWGHQDNAGGWNDLQSPCGTCAPVIRDFPVPTTNSLWRKFERPQDHTRKGAAPLPLGDAMEGIRVLYSGQEEVLL
jgi:hypothetical protein